MRAVLILVAVLAALFSLVRHFPLAWAGSMLPAGIGTYSGTIWNGQIHDVPLLGSLTVDGSLTGARLASAPGEVTFSGDVSPNGVRDLVLSMPIARLPTTDARLSGLAGRVSLRLDEAQIRDGACVSAVGTASTNVLAANRAQFDWTGPALSGPVDCVDGRLRVQLSGEDGAARVSATLLTGLDGVYQVDIALATSDVAAGNALTLFGFQPDGPDSYTLSEQGRWR